MQDTKNLILAIILSCSVLFLWQHFYASPKLKHAQEVAAQAAAEQAKTLSTGPEKNSIGGEINSPDKILSRDDAIKQSDRITIKTDSLRGSISLKGARFDDLTLEKYKNTIDPSSGDVVIFSPSGSSDVYFAEFGWVTDTNSNIVVPTAKTVWKTNDKILAENKPVSLFWDNGNGLKFSINIAVDKDYMFTITRKVENSSGSSISLLPYGLINRAYIQVAKPYAILHEGPIGAMDGLLTENTYNDLKKNKKTEFKNTVGWFGITDKYWFSAIIPDEKHSFNADFKYFYINGHDRYQVDYLGQRNEIAPGASFEVKNHLFAGAKEFSMLDKYREELHIPLFDRAVDFGRLYFITKPLFKLLTYFHKLSGNFGLAILLLTVCVKAALFPLANKSYASMHHLKRLQPQVTELKDKHKEDKSTLNKSIMELYRSERVNPMSGCLPMIVQIPVFFALYKVLFVTIEMRHAPFYGWIKDLSVQDPTSLFNLFGLISWTPPAFLMIGVLPIVMGLTMYIQQKLNPKPADPTQEKIMNMLPFIFVFMFSHFPAGLVIYWAWNNTLSIIQQLFITKRLPK